MYKHARMSVALLTTTICLALAWSPAWTAEFGAPQTGQWATWEAESATPADPLAAAVTGGRRAITAVGTTFENPSMNGEKLSVTAWSTWAPFASTASSRSPGRRSADPCGRS